jgi:uncharacterized protein (TIGR03382 family)
MGRALHSLQDGFSHAFRSDDGYRVLAVFNYLDPALSPDYEPARDGPPHASDLDHCDDELDFQPVSGSTAASAALLGAMAGTGSGEGRLAEAQRVLDTWLTYEAGCEAQNGWCGRVVQTATGCSSAPTGSALAWVSVATAALLALSRRRKRTLGTLPAVAACALALGGDAASAAEPTASLGSLRVSGGLTLDRAGAHVGVGAERAFTPAVRVGVEAEFNPWFELQNMTPSPGVLNASGVLTVVWGRPGGWEIQSGIRLGSSLLLATVPGARAGSFGLFFGASPVRVVMPIGPRDGLELSPDVAVAIPSLGGVPYVYRQYRFSIGYRWDL